MSSSVTDPQVEDVSEDQGNIFPGFHTYVSIHIIHRESTGVVTTPTLLKYGRYAVPLLSCFLSIASLLLPSLPLLPLLPPPLFPSPSPLFPSSPPLSLPFPSPLFPSPSPLFPSSPPLSLPLPSPFPLSTCRPSTSLSALVRRMMLVTQALWLVSLVLSSSSCKSSS